MRATFLFLFLCTLTAYANDTILVTATRTGTSRSDLPVSGNRISREDWDRFGSRPENALPAVPGLSFSANGGPGQTRSVFIRGARAEDTLVLIDGVPLNDPLSPSRSFDFSQIPVAEIESIEVLKGPQSVLYGSDAMGGVVQIFTKKTGSHAKFEGGSFGTLKARASHLGFHGGYERSNGISAADERNGNTERDGHKSWNLGGSKDFSLGENSSLRVQGLYHDNKTDTDRSGGVGGDSSGTHTRNSQLVFKAEALRISRDGYEWSTAGSIFTRDRDDNTTAPAFYKARLWKAETNVKKNFGSHTPTLGGEYYEEAGRSSDMQARRKFRAGALYLQEQYASGRWQAVAGGRVDFHSEHNRATTFRAGLGYWLEPEVLRAKTSVGTGYKAPSLYQTYSSFGTRGLRPSRIIGGDAGLELSTGPWQAELTYYRNHFRELIDFDTLTSRFFNIGRAETSGFEISLARAIGTFSLKNSLTTIRAHDKTKGRKLLRRPALSGLAEATYKGSGRRGISANLRYVGQREDIHPTLYSRQVMPSFLTIGLNAFQQISKSAKVTARVENLLNRRYQETSGFGTTGLSGYFGVEADL